MKNIFLIFTLLIITLSNQFSVAETVMVCQEEDRSATWIEVTVRLNDGPGLIATVLEHNNKTAKHKLLAKTLVFASVETGSTIFKGETLDLRVSKIESQLKGNLVLLQDGPNTIKASNLLCEK